MFADDTGAYSGVVHRSDGTTMIVSTGVLTSVQDFENVRRPLSSDDFARSWMDQFLRIHRSEAEKSQNRLLEIERQQLDISRQLGERRFIVTLLERAGVDAFREYLERVRTVPGAVAVRFQKEGIVVLTEDVWYRGPLAEANGGPRFFGRYRFVIDILHGKVTVQNLALHVEGQPQTCISCMGTFSGHIANCFRVLDYAGVVRVLLEYVRSPNLVGDGTQYSSDANRYRTYFRDHAPSNPIVGPPRDVYTGLGRDYNAELRDDASDDEDDED